MEKDTDRYEHRWGLEYQAYYKEKEQAADRAFKKLVSVSIVSLVFCLTEAFGGYISNSLAVLTDAAH